MVVSASAAAGEVGGGVERDDMAAVGRARCAWGVGSGERERGRLRSLRVRMKWGVCASVEVVGVSVRDEVMVHEMRGSTALRSSE